MDLTDLDRRYAGLVFDCDGTLADTMPAHFVAWQTVMTKYGLSFPEDRFYEMGGMPTIKIVAMLAEEQGVAVDVDVVAHEKELCFESRSDQVEPIEPVVAVAKAHEGKLPMGVATGSGRELATKLLDSIGVMSLFGTLVGHEDVERHKPEPDTYLLAAERLQVDPTKCLAFEDTDLGMSSAEAAGMDVVDIRPLVKVGL